MTDVSETLLDVVIRDGRLMKAIQRGDEVVYEPVENQGSDPFADTETVPATLVTPKTSAVERMPGRTRADHVDRSLAVEAVLVKYLSPRTSGPHTETVDTRGNAQLRALLCDLCRAMGGEWAEMAQRIR